MQIVIDIPEEEYQTYINHTAAILDSSIPLVHQDLLRAVINGTPQSETVTEFADRCRECGKQKTKWIPVSEGLPKPFSYVNCTCRSLIDDRAFWVVETCYVPQPKNSPYSDWGNIPMLNHGDCAVVAWMYREIPKPYKAESEDKE